MPNTTEKQWTVMVYLAGDNNLDSAGVIDLKEMKKVGSTDQVNVIAQFVNGQRDVDKIISLFEGHKMREKIIEKSNQSLPLKLERRLH